MNREIHVESWLLVIAVIGSFVVVNAYDCGQLKIQNSHMLAGDTVKMQLNPSVIVRPGKYRWLFENTTKRYIFFQKGHSSGLDQRLFEDNYTLCINDVRNQDEGIYMVECRYNSSFYYSNDVDLKLQAEFFTSTKLTTTYLEQTTKDFANLLMVSHAENEVCALKYVETDDCFGSNIQMNYLQAYDSESCKVVKTSPISLSASFAAKDSVTIDKANPNDKEDNSPVLVVLIITGAVVLVVTFVIVVVIWKRRAQKKEHNNDENAGIIGDNIGNDYAVVNDLGALPDHPTAANKLLIDTDTYNSIDQPPRNNQPTWCASIQDEYSQVIPKCFRQESEKQNFGQTFTDNKTQEYAVVIPKSVRAGSQCDQKLTNTNMINSCDIDEYATVASYTGRHAAREEGHNPQDVRVAQGNQYSNYLPSSVEDLTVDSHCEYSQVLPKTQRLLDIHGIDTAQRKCANQREIKKHEYDTPSPVIRRKTGVKDLQYVEIAHSDTSSYRSQSTESLSARPIEYVDIDFTKKAFVAPKRFPPPPSPKQNN